MYFWLLVHRIHTSVPQILHMRIQAVYTTTPKTQKTADMRDCIPRLMLYAYSVCFYTFPSLRSQASASAIVSRRGLVLKPSSLAAFSWEKLELLLSVYSE